MKVEDELKVPEMPRPLGEEPTKEALLKHFADVLRHYIFGQVKQELVTSKKSNIKSNENVEV